MCSAVGDLDNAVRRLGRLVTLAVVALGAPAATPAEHRRFVECLGTPLLAVCLLPAAQRAAAHAWRQAVYYRQSWPALSHPYPAAAALPASCRTLGMMHTPLQQTPSRPPVHF